MSEKYTIINVIWDFVRGRLTLADKSTVINRNTLCKKCEVRDPKLNICTACGCYIPFKTRVEKSSCPLEFW